MSIVLIELRAPAKLNAKTSQQRDPVAGTLRLSPRIDANKYKRIM